MNIFHKKLDNKWRFQHFRGRGGGPICEIFKFYPIFQTKNQSKMFYTKFLQNRMINGRFLNFRMNFKMLKFSFISDFAEFLCKKSLFECWIRMNTTCKKIEYRVPPHPPLPSSSLNLKKFIHYLIFITLTLVEHKN